MGKILVLVKITAVFLMALLVISMLYFYIGFNQDLNTRVIFFGLSVPLWTYYLFASGGLIVVAIIFVCYLYLGYYQTGRVLISKTEIIVYIIEILIAVALVISTHVYLLRWSIDMLTLVLDVSIVGMIGLMIMLIWMVVWYLAKEETIVTFD
jgi:hypothetical protein